MLFYILNLTFGGGLGSVQKEAACRENGKLLIHALSPMFGFYKAMDCNLSLYFFVGFFLTSRGVLWYF